METLGKITLYNADCMDIMRELPDKAFDLAIVDPPYGISVNRDKPLNTFADTVKNPRGEKQRKNRLSSGGGKLKNIALQNMDCEFDNILPTEEYFEELRRVSKNQIIWGGNYFPLPPTRGIIFWDKQQPWDNFSQFELAWTSFDCPAAVFRGSCSAIGKDKSKKIHPTQKPIHLYKWLLSKYAKPGQTILDTHLGSGSSAIAAHDGGFEFTGIELNPDYYAAARQRLINHQMQGNLFL